VCTELGLPCLGQQHPPAARAAADQVGLIADNMSIVNFESAQDVMREGEPGALPTQLNLALTPNLAVTLARVVGRRDPLGHDGGRHQGDRRHDALDRHRRGIVLLLVVVVVVVGSSIVAAAAEVVGVREGHNALGRRHRG